MLLTYCNRLLLLHDDLRSQIHLKMGREGLPNEFKTGTGFASSVIIMLVFLPPPPPMLSLPPPYESRLPPPPAIN